VQGRKPVVQKKDEFTRLENMSFDERMVLYRKKYASSVQKPAVPRKKPDNGYRKERSNATPDLIRKPVAAPVSKKGFLSKLVSIFAGRKK
jgi:hypothetical protein